jgi:hypothetical protein
VIIVLAAFPASAAARRRGWSVQAFFQTPPGQTVGLTDVSCASGSACTAIVGSTAEVWDGLRWSPRPFALPPRPRVPLRSRAPNLESVSCVRAGCVAAGSSLGACRSVCPPTPFTPKGYHYQERALVERLAGGRWAAQPAPSPGVYGSGLQGVSCSSARACVAVGSWSPIWSWGGAPLVERFDGKRWTTQAVVLPAQVTHTPGYNGATLLAVSCPSPSACMAVGAYYLGFPPQGETLFAERWDGATWAFQPLAPFNGQISADISCSSTSACTIIGTVYLANPGRHPFAERWNGTSWRAQTLPNPPRLAALTAVSCPTRNACMAVGNGAGLPHGSQLAEKWNGVRWRAQNIPRPPGFRTGFLDSISCTSANACTAIATGHGGWFVDRYQ